MEEGRVSGKGRRRTMILSYSNRRYRFVVSCLAIGCWLHVVGCFALARFSAISGLCSSIIVFIHTFLHVFLSSPLEQGIVQLISFFPPSARTFMHLINRFTKSTGYVGIGVTASQQFSGVLWPVTLERPQSCVTVTSGFLLRSYLTWTRVLVSRMIDILLASHITKQREYDARTWCMYTQNLNCQIATQLKRKYVSTHKIHLWDTFSFTAATIHDLSVLHYLHYV